MQVTYEATETSFTASKPEPWNGVNIASRGVARNWALHPDGVRAAFFENVGEGLTGESPLSHFNLVFNFFDELKRISKPKK
jgi:hypothetical protein